MQSDGVFVGGLVDVVVGTGVLLGHHVDVTHDVEVDIDMNIWLCRRILVMGALLRGIDNIAS